MTEDATETHPDIPPIVDERGYEAARQYVVMLEQRGVTSDTRNEQGALLLKLRRAMELYRLTPAAKREMDIHVMRMQLDNAESEAEALKARLAFWKAEEQSWAEQMSELRANWTACHEQHEAGLRLLLLARPHLHGVGDLVDKIDDLIAMLGSAAPKG